MSSQPTGERQSEEDVHPVSSGMSRTIRLCEDVQPVSSGTSGTIRLVEDAHPVPVSSGMSGTIRSVRINSSSPSRSSVQRLQLLPSGHRSNQRGRHRNPRDFFPFMPQLERRRRSRRNNNTQQRQNASVRLQFPDFDMSSIRESSDTDGSMSSDTSIDYVELIHNDLDVGIYAQGDGPSTSGSSRTIALAQSPRIDNKYLSKQKAVKRPRLFHLTPDSDDDTNMPSSSHLKMNQLAKNLQDLRNNNRLTDVVLSVGGREIVCHRCVMASCSQYFERLFEADMQERQSGRIEIVNHKHSTIELLVRYAYSESVSVNADNAQDIIEAADYYQMNGLKACCEQFLITQISQSNCLGFMQFARLHNLQKLWTSSLDFSTDNFLEVYRQEEFCLLSYQELCLYLTSDRLIVKQEEQVFYAVLSWLQRDSTRLIHTTEVLKCVRLSFVSPFFLFNIVAEHELLQNNDEVLKMILKACKSRLLGYKSNEIEEPQKPRNSAGISEVLVAIGGICNNLRLCYTDYFDKAHGWRSFENISTQHSHMHSYSVCTLHDDIIVTGGHTNNAMTTDATSLLQTRFNKWVELTPMCKTRERHGSASLGGFIYVTGGLSANTTKKKPLVLNDVERFNPIFNKWEEIKPLPKKCYSPGVVSLHGKLYVIGGVSMKMELNNSSKVVLDCVQCYDPITEEWSILPLHRQLARLACTVYKGHIYLLANNIGTIFRYNPLTAVLEEWTELESTDFEFSGLTTFNNTLVITGGQDGSHTSNVMTVFDFETRKMISTLTMMRPLCMHGCVTIDKYG